jgi:hypothetical protein
MRSAERVTYALSIAPNGSGPDGWQTASTTLANGGRYSRHVKLIRIGLLILAHDQVSARQTAGLLLYEMSPSARPDR